MRVATLHTFFHTAVLPENLCRFTRTRATSADSTSCSAHCISICAARATSKARRRAGRRAARCLHSGSAAAASLDRRVTSGTGISTADTTYLTCCALITWFVYKIFFTATRGSATPPSRRAQPLFTGRWARTPSVSMEDARGADNAAATHLYV